jgi:excisionase family DNA binding protein
MESKEEHDMSLAEAAPVGPKFYDVREVAVMFRMSRMTVYRAIGTGELPAVRMRGRWLVPAKVIDDLVEQATNGAVPDVPFLSTGRGRS